MPESPALKAWLDRIEAQHPAEIELGLARVAAVAGRMGLLPAPLPVVVIGGTNGKGSTLAFLEAALTAAGHTVGAYTSPHLFRFNERVRLAGLEAADDALIAAFHRVEAAREGTPLTYFEFATLAAMAVFAEQADIALLEVGLGGRLDAVNIWEPTVAVVTSVALDHQAFLGADREAIGFEKAGIFRSGVPAVCGDPDPPRSVLAGGGDDLRCIGRDFALTDAGGEVWWRGDGQAVGPLPATGAPYQARNAATAIAAGQCLPAGLAPRSEHWRTALAGVRLPGRAQRMAGEPPVWLDVAHNPAAATELARLLAKEPVPGETYAVFGAMHDKDVEGIRAAMAPVVNRWYPCGVSGDRGLSGEALCARLPAAPLAEGAPFADAASALEAARRAARPGRDRIVVLGSFLMVAAVLEAAGPETGASAPMGIAEGEGGHD